MFRSNSRISLPLLLAVLASFSEPMFAKDYLVTIGGGYEPAGNQASLEANVLFFQQVIQQKHSAPVEQRIYFADGTDNQEDLQVLVPNGPAETPAIELLRSVFALERSQVAYRNHQVPEVDGPIRPGSIQRGLEQIIAKLVRGDRLIVYVTAHGSAAVGGNPMNTSITCWNKQSLSMKTFSKWLDACPSEVPVILVMAQCYCGGFADTLFEAGDAEGSLSPGLRIGFYAQQHDLPAAGCRPDIENDEEYSSYFWGAFVGHSRSGTPTKGVDLDGNGRVSFAEAHSYAVRASATIDIPMCSSDAFLRHFSWIPEYEMPSYSRSVNDTESTPELAHLPGHLAEVIGMASPTHRPILESLVEQLQLSSDIEMSEVLRLRNDRQAAMEQSRSGPARRGPGRRGPRGGARRALQREVVERWPDVQSPDQWGTLERLHGEPGATFLAEMKQLPNFEAFQQSLNDRKKSRDQASRDERQSVLLRRLVQTIESVVLAENLPRIADAETLVRFRDILQLEASYLDSPQSD